MSIAGEFESYSLNATSNHELPLSSRSVIASYGVYCSPVSVRQTTFAARCAMVRQPRKVRTGGRDCIESIFSCAFRPGMYSLPGMVGTVPATNRGVM